MGKAARRAVVVGAGVNGLCAAWALRKRGWEVTVADRGPIPNPEAASWDSHRLMRPHYPGQPGYAARIEAARASWSALEAALGERLYVETGALSLSRAAGDRAAQAALDFARRGVAHEVLEGAALARRFPMIDPEGVAFGVHTSFGGALLADRALWSLAAALRRRGARLVEGFRAARIDWEAGAAIAQDGARLEGDALIVAAGAGLPALTRDALGEMFTPHRCVFLYADPPPRWREAWARGPVWTGLGGADDLWGAPPVLGLPMKLGMGALTRPADPETARLGRDADAEAILRAYRCVFRDGDAISARALVADVWTGAPEDRFVLRRVGRGWVLSADSGHGFKFGPLTGEDVAEAVDGGDAEAVARRLAGRLEPA